MSAGRFVVSLLLLLPTGLGAQGLGDAAAKERAKRAKPEAPATASTSAVKEAAPVPSPTPIPSPAPLPATARDNETSAPAFANAAALVESPTREQPPPVAPAPPAQPTPVPYAPTRPDLSRPRDEPFEVRWHDLELHARFLGQAFSERTETATEDDLEAENIRLDLRWRPRPWLRAVLEGDFAMMVERGLNYRKIQLKDALLELRHGGFRARAGQFKSPISPLEMESPWDVPAAERGLLSDVLRFCYGIAGRKPGLELRWKQKGGPLGAAVAVQRATSTRGERIGDESFDNVAKDWGALTTTGRLAWEGERLEVGGVFDLRAAEPLPGEGYQRFWTAGADLSWRVKSRAGARLWAEVYAGSSWQDANAFDGRSTRFLAGRVLGAWSFFLQERRSFYVEPYLMGSLLEPDTSVRDDLVWEASGGLHLGAFGHLRLVLEAQRRGYSRNTPASLGLAAAGGPPAESRTRLVAQIGAAF